MRNRMLVVCMATVLSGYISGCGAASASSTSTLENNVTMQGGQWEYVVTPDNGGTAMYLGVNLTKTNVEFNANNLVIFQPSQITLAQNTAPIECGSYSFMGLIGGTKFDGELGTPTGAFGSFSGQLSSDGQSISNGKYSGQACATIPSKVTGTLTGYTVAPLNGTFTGKLTSNTNGESVMTVSFTQKADFSVGITGTFVENGVTTSFVDVPGPDSSLISGASVSFGVDAVNVNGKSQYAGMGHWNPKGTQIDLFLSGPNEAIVGTLTKQ